MIRPPPSNPGQKGAAEARIFALLAAVAVLSLLAMGVYLFLGGSDEATTPRNDVGRGGPTPTLEPTRAARAVPPALPETAADDLEGESQEPVAAFDWRKGAERGDASLRLRIVDALTNEPVPDLRYSIFTGMPRQANLGLGKTDAEGLADLDRLPRRSILVETERRPPFAPTVAGIDLSQGDFETLEIRVSPGGTLLGRVVDDLGRPLEGVNVSLPDAAPGPMAKGIRMRMPEENDRTLVMTTDASGRFEVGAVTSLPRSIWIVEGELRPAAWQSVTLQFQRNEASTTLEANVKDGETRVLDDVVLPRPRIYAGKVLHADGTPAFQALVSLDAFAARRSFTTSFYPGGRLRPRPGPESPDFELASGEALTNEQGAFELEASEKSHNILVTTGDGQKQVFVLPQVGPGEATQDLVLRLDETTVLEIEIVDARGQRLPAEAFTRESRMGMLSRPHPLRVEAELDDGDFVAQQLDAQGEDLFRTVLPCPPSAVRRLALEAPDQRCEALDFPSGLRSGQRVTFPATAIETHELRLALHLEQDDSSSGDDKSDDKSGDKSGDNKRKKKIQIHVLATLVPPESLDERTSLYQAPCGLGAAAVVSLEPGTTIDLEVATPGPYWIYVAGMTEESPRSFGPYPADDTRHDLPPLDPSEFEMESHSRVAKEPPPTAATPKGKGRVTVLVLDAETGKSLDRILMSVERQSVPSSPEKHQPSKIYLSSELGAGIEASLAAGTYSVILEQRGYQSSSLFDFSVEDGGTTDLGTVELVPHPSLRLRILQPDGTPIPRSSRVRAAGDEDVPFFLWVPVLDGGLVEVRPGEDTPDTVTLVVATHPRVQTSAGGNPAFQHLRAEGGSSSSGEPRTVTLAPWKRVDVEVAGLPADRAQTTLRIGVSTQGDEGIRLTSSIPEIHSSSPTTRTFRCFLAPGRYTFSAESPLLSIDDAQVNVGEGESPLLVRLRVR